MSTSASAPSRHGTANPADMRKSGAKLSSLRPSSTGLLYKQDRDAVARDTWRYDPGPTTAWE